MKTSFLIKSLSILTFLMLSPLSGWSQILTFDFASLAGNEVSANSNSNDANLGSSTITRGAGLNASNNSGRFNANSWATTSIANAVSGDDYMEFTITPNTNYEFTISSINIRLQRSSTGPSAIAIRSSIDGYDSNLDQEYAITDVTSTQSFTFTISQSAQTSAVTYRIYMWAESTGGSGGIGDFSGDDIEVFGSVALSAVPNVGWDSSSSSENETDVSFGVNIPVTFSDWSQQVIMDVAVTGGTAESGDYTLNTSQLTFNANGSQNVSIDINDDADADDETIIITLTENTSTGVVITSSTHTITVTDDEIPPAGWQITSADQIFTLDFESTVSGVNEGEFNGSGFTSSPSDGQLDSDSWALTGASDGDVAFGGSGTTGDFARGTNSGGTGTGGTFAFEVSSSNYALGVQSGGSDFTPGGFTLRTQNQTGSSLTSALVAYTVYIYNDQGRSTEAVFAHSTDNSSYTDVSEITETSETTADGSPSWQAYRMFTTISSLSVSDGDYLYLRWTFDDVGGSGSRDEIAIDDIQVIYNPSTTNFSPLTGTYAGIKNNGAALSVSSNTTLEVTGDLLNNGTFTLNADATGYAQMKTSGSITGSGSMTVEQYIANTGWHNLGIPLDISSLDDLGDVGDQAGSGAQNTYYWDASAGSWVNQTSSDADVAGRGYLVFVGTYGIASSAPATISLSGSPYTSHTPTLNYGASNDEDWNLIANPFTCALDFDAINVDGAGTNVNNAFSIWDPSANAGAGNYVEFSSISPTTEEIAPMQAFWVQTTGSSPSIPAMSMATHGTVSSTPTYYKTQNIIADRFFLHTYQATDQNFEDDLLIGMVHGATDGMDNAYDAGARIGNSVAPHLMSVESGREMSINAIDYSPNNTKEKEMQLRFVSGKQGEVYFIELVDSLLSNNYNIYLEDLKERRLHNLGSRAYKFVHDPLAEYRFVLRISPVTTVNDNHTHVSVGTSTGVNGGTLVFKMDAPERDLDGEIIDLNGKIVKRFIYPSGVSEFRLDVSGFSSGVYLMKLFAETGEEVHKILIQ